MTVRRLAVFSGFDPRVVESIRTPLQRGSIGVASVSLPARLDEVYFSRLARRSVDLLPRLTSDGAWVQGILISCLNDRAERDLEKRYFFPALRRLQIDRMFKSDVYSAKKLRTLVEGVFASDVFADARKVVLDNAPPLALLPVKNVESEKLRADLLSIFHLRSTEVSGRVLREISKLPGRDGVDCRGVSFIRQNVKDETGSVDHDQSPECELAGAMRLGVSIPTDIRFEVAAKAGLAGRQFYRCDGKPERIESAVTQLRMRVNCDFEAIRT